MKLRWKFLIGFVAVALFAAWMARDTLRMLAFIPDFETSVEAGVSFETVQTPRPNGATCLVEDTGGHLAMEMLSLETLTVVVGLGDGAMPEAEWAAFTPDLPWRKNLNRNLIYNTDCFLRSPDAPADCDGGACAILQEVAGYPWMELSAVVVQDCFADEGASCSGPAPSAGAVTLTVTRKCHYLIYEDEIFEMADPDGNRFVMHATETGMPSVDADLPEGWTLSRVALDTPLDVAPFGGGDQCYHNVMRDNLGQGYHQFVFAGAAFP